jgi:uncharacterized membrane protein HdeD (DUF308 family)
VDYEDINNKEGRMDTDQSYLGGHLILRGVVTILFGLAAIFWPGLTLLTLVFIFSAFVLVMGILDIVGGIRKLVHGAGSMVSRLLMLVFGAVEVGVGVYLLRHQSVRIGVFIAIIGFTLLVRGVMELIETFFSDNRGTHKALMVFVSIITILAGILVLMQPVRGGVAFVWVLGVYALIAGSMWLALAFEVNRAEDDVRTAVKNR